VIRLFCTYFVWLVSVVFAVSTVLICKGSVSGQYLFDFDNFDLDTLLCKLHKDDCRVDPKCSGDQLAENTYLRFYYEGYLYCHSNINIFESLKKRLYGETNVELKKYTIQKLLTKQFTNYLLYARDFQHKNGYKYGCTLLSKYDFVTNQQFCNDVLLYLYELYGESCSDVCSLEYVDSFAPIDGIVEHLVKNGMYNEKKHVILDE